MEMIFTVSIDSGRLLQLITSQVRVVVGVLPATDVDTL